MPRLNKIIWTLVILFIVVTTIVFSFGIILIGVSLASIYGIYRRFFTKKKSVINKFHTKHQTYTFGEVIDIKPEVVQQSIEANKTKQ